MKSFKEQIVEFLTLWNFDEVKKSYEKAYLENSLDNEDLMSYAIFLYENAYLDEFKKLTDNKKPHWWDDERLEFSEQNPNFLNEFYTLRKDISKITADKIYTLFNNCDFGNSKSYFIAFVMDYFLSLDYKSKEIFFNYDIKLKFNFFNHLYHNQEAGAKRYLEYYLSFMSDFYQSKRTNRNAKIAICFYGSLRGDWDKKLSTTINNLSKYFGADSFVFTWNKEILFPSINNGLHEWVNRNYPQYASKAPKDINDKRIFFDIMPNTYEKLGYEYYLPLNDKFEKFAKKHKSIKTYEVATQEHLAGYFIAGAWMFYGQYMAFNLLREYEKKFNFKYDYVFIWRIDDEIDKFNKDLLINYKNSLYNFGWYGHGSSFAQRDIIEINVNLFSYIKTCYGKLENIFDNHSIEPNWCAVNGIRYHMAEELCNHYFLHTNFNYSFPNVSKEFKKDKEILRQKGYTEEQIQSFKEFFEFLMKECKYIPKKASKFFRMHYYHTGNKTIINAKNIVKSSLEFRIGKKLIKLFKNPLFYIFGLIYLYKLKLEVDFELNSIQQQKTSLPFFNLELYTNYAKANEAQKITSFFTYKLGALFLKYKEQNLKGFFIFIFKIFKLKQNSSR